MSNDKKSKAQPVTSPLLINDDEILSCTLSRDAETSRWLAHCLNFDLITSGKDQDSAWQNLIRIVRAHIEHSLTFHHAGDLVLRASDEEWELFNRSKKSQKNFRSEKVTLRPLVK